MLLSRSFLTNLIDLELSIDLFVKHEPNSTQYTQARGMLRTAQGNQGA